jgi:hypothetical protein
VQVGVPVVSAHPGRGAAALQQEVDPVRGDAGVSRGEHLPQLGAKLAHPGEVLPVRACVVVVRAEEGAQRREVRKLVPAAHRLQRVHQVDRQPHR